MENHAVLRSVPDRRVVVHEGMAHNIADAVPERRAAGLLAFPGELAREGRPPPTGQGAAR